MNDLKRRVNALRRKMALALAVVRLRRLADEFSLQWAAAIADRRPAPGFHPFVSQLVDAGFRLPTLMALHKNLDRCRRQNTIPRPEEIVRSLLPWYPAHTAPRPRRGSV